jgi:hypothetical protein
MPAKHNSNTGEKRPGAVVYMPKASFFPNLGKAAQNTPSGLRILAISMGKLLEDLTKAYAAEPVRSSMDLILKPIVLAIQAMQAKHPGMVVYLHDNGISPDNLYRILEGKLQRENTKPLILADRDQVRTVKRLTSDLQMDLNLAGVRAVHRYSEMTKSTRHSKRIDLIKPVLLELRDNEQFRGTLQKVAERYCRAKQKKSTETQKDQLPDVDPEFELAWSVPDIFNQVFCKSSPTSLYHYIPFVVDAYKSLREDEKNMLSNLKESIEKLGSDATDEMRIKCQKLEDRNYRFDPTWFGLPDPKLLCYLLDDLHKFSSFIDSIDWIQPKKKGKFRFDPELYMESIFYSKLMFYQDLSAYIRNWRCSFYMPSPHQYNSPRIFKYLEKIRISLAFSYLVSDVESLTLLARLRTQNSDAMTFYYPMRGLMPNVRSPKSSDKPPQFMVQAFRLLQRNGLLSTTSWQNICIASERNTRKKKATPQEVCAIPTTTSEGSRLLTQRRAITSLQSHAQAYAPGAT